ncbi:MAG: hypothetical protein ACREAN_07460 [Nitrosopumilaceae archaeon]
MSQIQEIMREEGKKEVQSKGTKTPKEAKNPKITDDLIQRALNGGNHNSEIKTAIEKVAKGPILTPENRAIEIIDSNVGAVNRVIKEAGFKGKVKGRSTEEGKSKPTMLWRVE